MLLASGWGLEKSLSMQGVAGFKTEGGCQKEWKGYFCGKMVLISMPLLGRLQSF